MGRAPGRTTEQTRRLLLDAAGDVFRTRGMHATLDDVAREAGVSKGGLIYHFASKDELILALAVDLLEGFEREVDAALEPGDEPGRLTRAYVRATLSMQLSDRTEREEFLLIAQLLNHPVVAERAREYDRELKRKLAADGLPQELVTLVTSAADGIEMSVLWGGETTSATRQALMDQLIAMTHNP